MNPNRKIEVSVGAYMVDMSVCIYNRFYSKIIFMYHCLYLVMVAARIYDKNFFGFRISNNITVGLHASYYYLFKNHASVFHPLLSIRFDIFSNFLIIEFSYDAGSKIVEFLLDKP